MESRLLTDMEYCLDHLKAMRSDQEARIKKVSKYSDTRIKQLLVRNKRIYYGAAKVGSNKIRYIGNDSKPEIGFIREARYLSKSLSIIEKDIMLMEDFLDRYESTSFNNVNMKLPKAYRASSFNNETSNEIAARWKQKAEAYKASFKVFRPEELIHRTVDGNMVRSKSEQSIYNTMAEAGYTFVYELPIKGMTRWFFPDFTILSEIDYSTEVKIEHQGMFADDNYREKAEARQYEYWRNGYLPGRDVYFTFDDFNGGFDIQPIMDILKMRVRPDGGNKN